jgi:hypothetical protein
MRTPKAQSFGGPAHELLVLPCTLTGNLLLPMPLKKSTPAISIHLVLLWLDIVETPMVLVLPVVPDFRFGSLGCCGSGTPLLSRGS